MAAPAVEVKCVDLTERYGGHEHISHLGGDGWHWTRDQVVAAIESGRYRFFTKSGTAVAWLYMRRGRFGKFVQTVSDGKWSNNLFALRRCR